MPGTTQFEYVSMVDGKLVMEVHKTDGSVVEFCWANSTFGFILHEQLIKSQEDQDVRKASA